MWHECTYRKRVDETAIKSLGNTPPTSFMAMDNDGDTPQIDLVELVRDTATVDKKKGPGASAPGLGGTPFTPPSVEVERRG